jgi:predicted ABC-class ATPase
MVVVQTKDTLIAKLKAIDNKDYAAYQSLLGEYDYKGFKLFIHQIPKDPYAPPHTGIYNKKSVYAKEVQRLNFGKNVIDLTDVEQLIELSQTRAIGQALCYINKYIDGEKTLSEVINLFFHDLENNGLDILSDKISGHFAEFRRLELAFTLNRLRGIKMRQKEME